jgi:hypothetical protein
VPIADRSQSSSTLRNSKGNEPDSIPLRLRTAGRRKTTAPSLPPPASANASDWNLRGYSQAACSLPGFLRGVRRIDSATPPATYPQNPLFRILSKPRSALRVLVVRRQSGPRPVSGGNPSEIRQLLFEICRSRIHTICSATTICVEGPLFE